MTTIVLDHVFFDLHTSTFSRDRRGRLKCHVGRGQSWFLELTMDGRVPVDSSNEHVPTAY